MVVHPTMEFKFCFSYVLLLTFIAVNEVTYVIGFTCDRLLDVVYFRVIVTGYGCGECPSLQMAHLGSDSQGQNPGVVGLLDFLLCSDDL